MAGLLAALADLAGVFPEDAGMKGWMRRKIGGGDLHGKLEMGAERRRKQQVLCYRPRNETRRTGFGRDGGEMKICRESACFPGLCRRCVLWESMLGLEARIMGRVGVGSSGELGGEGLCDLLEMKFREEGKTPERGLLQSWG